MRIKVPKNDDAIFCTNPMSIFIAFNFVDYHSRDGIAEDGTEGLVLFFSDIFPGLGFFMKTIVFLCVRFVSDCLFRLRQLVMIMKFGFKRMGEIDSGDFADSRERV